MMKTIMTLWISGLTCTLFAAAVPDNSFVRIPTNPDFVFARPLTVDR